MARGEKYRWQVPVSMRPEDVRTETRRIWIFGTLAVFCWLLALIPRRSPPGSWSPGGGATAWSTTSR